MRFSEAIEEQEQRGGGRGGGVKKGKNTEAKIKVTLEQLYGGQTKSLRITRRTIDKSSVKTCSNCGGTGVVTQARAKKKIENDRAARRGEPRARDAFSPSARALSSRAAQRNAHRST